MRMRIVRLYTPHDVAIGLSNLVFYYYEWQQHLAHLADEMAQ